MPTTLQQLQQEAARAASITAVQAAIADSTKTLTTDVLTSLVTLATGRNIDGGLVHDVDDRNLRVIAQSEANHLTAVQSLTAQIAAHAHTIDVLNSRLNDIRTYLRLGTAEELEQAVKANQTKSLTDAEIAAAKAKALERAAQAQARQK